MTILIIKILPRDLKELGVKNKYCTVKSIGAAVKKYGYNNLIHHNQTNQQD
jgi:hypothetical protein